LVLLLGAHRSRTNRSQLKGWTGTDSLDDSESSAAFSGVAGAAGAAPSTSKEKRLSNPIKVPPQQAVAGSPDDGASGATATSATGSSNGGAGAGTAAGGTLKQRTTKAERRAIQVRPSDAAKNSTLHRSAMAMADVLGLVRRRRSEPRRPSCKARSHNQRRRSPPRRVVLHRVVLVARVASAAAERRRPRYRCRRRAAPRLRVPQRTWLWCRVALAAWAPGPLVPRVRRHVSALDQAHRRSCRCTTSTCSRTSTRISKSHPSRSTPSLSGIVRHEQPEPCDALYAHGAPIRASLSLALQCTPSCGAASWAEIRGRNDHGLERASRRVARYLPPGHQRLRHTTTEGTDCSTQCYLSCHRHLAHTVWCGAVVAATSRPRDQHPPIHCIPQAL